MKAPFPWFGGKSRVSSIVWDRFGDVPNYVEPFAGSLAVLLDRPTDPRIETVNDLDGYIANFWRAVAQVPEQVAAHADWPVNENDLHARHLWLVARKADLNAQLEGDPDYFDAKIAGWWVWGISSWIGGGWCSGDGPWQSVDGKMEKCESNGQGIERKRIHLGNAGQGINRQRIHLGPPEGINRKRIHLGAGQGIKRRLPHLGAGKGINRQNTVLHQYFAELSARLRRVRVASGDWARVMGPSVTTTHGLTGVFLDPPYGHQERAILYVEDHDIAPDACRWSIEHGDDPLMRIALCGYEGEHEMPDTWDCVPWKAYGGYSNLGNGRGKENVDRERIWFSPHCLSATNVQRDLFSVAG